jgi:Cu/Ag efflux protein CusF
MDMKSFIKVASATVLALALASGVFAAEFTKGTVKKVDAKAKKVTIIHEELKSLEMPAMTMVFRVKDDAMLEKLKEGASIEFVAERVEGKITVTEVK